jgi:hypothetical protein
MRGSSGRAAAVLAGLLALAAPLAAQEPVATRVMVRVLSRDAKLIGSGVGGAAVRIVNVETGEVLAEGQQQGGTGDTPLIMSTPHTRGMRLYGTEGTAGYLAQLSLSRPTVVEILAAGPLGYPQAVQTASKRMLVVPGEHVEGDGVVLELHGFIVEVVSPEPMTPLAGEVRVTARVRMMCGCPIEPGGLWDANAKEVTARLKADGAVVAVAPLEYAGQSSMFSGALALPAEARGRDLTLEVLVSDPAGQNFGRHEIPVAGSQ